MGIDALELHFQLKQEFQLQGDFSLADFWHKTVHDLYESILGQLRRQGMVVDEADVWRRLITCIAHVTQGNPADIRPETPVSGLGLE